MEKIGITTTIPIEIIYAAGLTPVDLNNIFINSEKKIEYIESAEKFGFPRTTCSWIKGIYTACLKHKIKKVIAVTCGDCSNTHALMEILEMQGIEVIPFAYPYNKSRKILQYEINNLIKKLNTSLVEVKKIKEILDNDIRKKLQLIDEYTWEKNLVTGKENHYFLINSSDFKSNYNKFLNEINKFINNLKKRKPIKNKIRIGYIGVPTIFTDLYEYINSLDGHIVFNEIERQFSMPNQTKNLTDQYLLYTYPYSIFGRIEDIQDAIKKREIHGIINYVQTFCFRHIEDVILRKKIDIPLLTIEGDKPGPLDARTKIRIETFMYMLKHNN